MSKSPQIVKEVITLLESRGHQCMMYNISKGILEWCNKDQCIRTQSLKDMAYRNTQAMEFADELRKQGHCCVRIMESYPVQISWCNQETCNNN
jgi:hypothetical protein